MRMDQILRVLTDERDRLDRAIAALQGRGRRGRPPKLAVPGYESPNPRKRRGMSEAARRKASLRMKAYWKAKRAAGK
jgi:hypothetical protein